MPIFLSIHVILYAIDSLLINLDMPIYGDTIVVDTCSTRLLFTIWLYFVIYCIVTYIIKLNVIILQTCITLYLIKLKDNIVNAN